MNINTIISVGEFFDKITILEIKKKKIHDKEKLSNVNNELTELRNIEQTYNLKSFQLNNLIKNLYNVNLELWNIEDKIRVLEKSKSFDSEFIQLARSVYITNDLRANLKKEINIKSKSNLIEEKSYEKY
jgi:hypothetical protein